MARLVVVHVVAMGHTVNPRTLRSRGLSVASGLVG